MSNRAMKDSGIEWIGEIPENWETSSYGKILKRYRAFDDNPNKQVLSLTIQGVKERNTSVSYGKMAEDYTKHQLVKNGQLIFTPRDFDCTPILSGIAPCDGCISNLYFVLDSKGFVDLNFINYQMWGVKWGGDIWRQLSYGMRFSFNFSQFSALKLAIPPLHEQQAIATYLDEQVSRLDQLIEDQQQVIEDWKAYKQSIITETVTKGLDPEVEMKDSGIEWIGEIPSHWGVAKLKKIISEKITDGPHETPKFISEGVPFLSVDAIVDGKLSFNNCRFVSILAANEYLKKCYPKKGDILMGKSASVGKIAMVVSDDKFCVWSPLALIRIDKLKSFNKYIEYHLKSNISQYEIEIRCTNSTQKNIGMKTISNLTTIIPPLQEQQQIADFLDEKCSKIDQLIEDKQRLIEDLKTYKQSLIYECVTGKKEIV